MTPVWFTPRRPGLTPRKNAATNSCDAQNRVTEIRDPSLWPSFREQPLKATHKVKDTLDEDLYPNFVVPGKPVVYETKLPQPTKFWHNAELQSR